MLKNTTAKGNEMKQSLEWDYGQTPVTPEDIVEAIAERCPTADWDSVSARLSYLDPEVFCEKHGRWESDDTDCSGAVVRFRLVDTWEGDGPAMLAPALLTSC